MVYLKLHNLALTGNLSNFNVSGHLLGIYFAMGAVNLGEAAEKEMRLDKMGEIYTNAALRVKESYPRTMYYLER